MGGFAREWYVLRSKPRREGLAGNLLERAGIEVYVPSIKCPKTRTQPARLEPFFPSYLFARLDPTRGELRLANYTAGVLHVVGFGEQPTPIPAPLVEEIRVRLLSGRARAQPIFERGERVVITSGPLDDVEAIFDRELSPTGRVRVLIEMLERLCPVDLKVEQLRRRTPSLTTAAI